MHMKVHAGWRPYFWRKCWQMQMLCKTFLMSEEFEDPHGHYTLEKGLLHCFSRSILKIHFKLRKSDSLPFWNKIVRSFVLPYIGTLCDSPFKYKWLTKNISSVKYVERYSLQLQTWASITSPPWGEIINWPPQHLHLSALSPRSHTFYITDNSHPYWENMFCRLTLQHRTVPEICLGNTKTKMVRNPIWKMQYLEVTNWGRRTDKLGAELNLL